MQALQPQVRKYFFDRSAYRGAFHKVDKDAPPQVREAAAEFRKSAKACFAHFKMGQKAKGGVWDYKFIVKGQLFSDFVGFLFTSDEECLVEWGRLGHALKSGKLVSSRKKKNDEMVPIYVVC
jgi:hypothetical protein